MKDIFIKEYVFFSVSFMETRDEIKENIYFNKNK